jgi:hypothetical protein
MSFNNIVLFGADGTRINHHILKALQTDGSFRVTTIGRQSSNTEFPISVNVITVPDTFPHDDIVAALKGHTDLDERARSPQGPVSIDRCRSRGWDKEIHPKRMGHGKSN